MIYVYYCIYLCSLNSGRRKVSTGTLVRLLIPCILLPAVARPGEQQASDRNSGVHIQLEYALTRFGEALPLRTSSRLGIFIGLPVFGSATAGVRITRFSSTLQYDSPGTTGTLPLSVTAAEAVLNVPLWTPAASLSLDGALGAGPAVITAPAHTISLGALGTRSLPARTEVRPSLSASLPLRAGLGQMTISAAPAVGWMFGPGGPITHLSLCGGIGLAIH